MKKIIAILLLSTSLSAFADSASPLHDGTGTNHVVALVKADLLSVFDSVAAQGTNVCLKFKSQGARYLCITNGRRNGHKMSSYGETIILPEGGTLSLHERHGSLSFEPIRTSCGARGFFVRKKMDFRTYGEKDVLEKKGCLLFVQSDDNGDEVDDSGVFKGLKLREAPPEAVNSSSAVGKSGGEGDGAGHSGKTPVPLDSQCEPGCTNQQPKPALKPEMVTATNVIERAEKR